MLPLCVQALDWALGACSSNMGRARSLWPGWCDRQV